MRQSVILAAGGGTRMKRPDPGAELDAQQSAAADAGRKGLMPFAGRPFLDYVLRELARVGIEKALLVVAPGDSASATRYSEQGSGVALAVEITAVVQEEPRGTADALLHCRRAVRDGPFLLVNSDNFYPAADLEPLAAEGGMACLGLDLAAVVRSGRSNLTAERLSAWAVLDVDSRGLLKRILEKPAPEVVAALAPPLLVSPNAWRLTPEIFEACRSIAPSVRGEYELPDAVQHAIDGMGCRVRVLPTRAAVLDLSTRADVAWVARLLPAWGSDA